MTSLMGINRIVLLPSVEEAAFEKFMREELMPSVEVPSRGVRSMKQHLLKAYQTDREDKYLWIIALEHFGSEGNVPSAIPALFDEAYSQVREKLAAYGIRTSFVMFEDIELPVG